MKKVFKGDGSTFSATYEAEKWLADNGYSVGSMQRGEPRAIFKGGHCIPKWRNLNVKERAAADGLMTGNGREGPITVEIKEPTND